MNEVFVKCLFEFIGTAILILFGDGVVASNCLKKSKGENGGWVVITIAWGLAVMLGVFIAGPYSGAHLNPAVTLGLAAAGTFSWSLVVPYIVSQMLGGFVGAVLVYAFYKDHYDATSDPAAKLGTFCTIPAIRNYGRNLFSEIIGTFVLVFVILALATRGNTPELGMGAIGAFPVSMLIIALGMSLGLRHQPGPRPRTAHRARRPSDQGQGFERLGLLVGSRTGSRHRRIPRRGTLLSRLLLLTPRP